ncbi:c-type cytochrome [Aliiroseovarius crassostreae]|uniref:c-type cytochrome n=1 Tax=Aliiroseovarius crassostreae TaxID=154981 RepID=UPI002208D637|nr:cytochrome c family protein [Aliiroseovarius crassostreae]UWP88532.1 cytochrome c family protein [Aliiroseovarius crassostreae]UWQ01186.1 cytochrome c family protein [Aliiroseovarius crassostreae]
MFDTMTLTKAGGALCGALLVFLLGSWVANILFTEGDSHAADGHATTGFVLAAGEEAAEEEVVEEVSFEELLASADAEKGAKVWSKCKACHKLEDGANGTGPHLYGLIDRPIASIDGFGYSDALAGLAGSNWTAEELNIWLTDPKGYAPGNKMTFKGLKKDTDRANLIAYLGTIGG